LLLPSQFCTLVKSKRGGYAASHSDATTLAVPADILQLTLLWEQPLGARKPECVTPMNLVARLSENVADKDAA
jgi:hypothetical protein